MSAAFLTFAIVLQCFLLVERCSSQAPPLPNSGVRLFHQLREIKNHSIISGGEIGFNLNQGIFCQSANTSATAEWFAPPRLNNPVRGGRTLIAMSLPGQSALVKNGSLALALSDDGLYQCLTTDEQGKRHTLVVGIYNSIRYLLNTGPKLVSPVEYTLVSAVDSSVPVFRLSFLLADSPATTLSCSRNGVQLQQSVQPVFHREIFNTERTITRITLEIMTGDGLYNCSISNDRVLMSNNPTAVPAVIVTEIFATESPSNVTVDQTGLNSILVLWSAPAEPISQYKVFVNQISENIQIIETTTTTEAAVHGLRPDETYSIFIIAISARLHSLPSQRTNNITITLDRHFNSSSTTTPTPERTAELSVISSSEFIAVLAVCGGLLLICIAINAAVIGFAVQTWRKAKRVIDTNKVNVNLTECLAYGSNVQPPQARRPMYEQQTAAAPSTGQVSDQETDIDSNYIVIEADNTDETYEQLMH